MSLSCTSSPSSSCLRCESPGLKLSCAGITPDLVSWRRTTFIPLAEETGVIRSLGAWVIESACEHASALQSLFGESITISINLSAVQLGQPGMLAHIVRNTSSAGLKPRSVQFEITESVLMRDDKQAARNLLELRDLGFELAIDDFGAGYASLGYLKQFEVDAIKIDKSFMSDLSDPRNAALCRGTIQLGHSLGMVVVAEGIETEQQRQFLVKFGCDLGQGYLLGRPMDEKQLNERLSLHGLESRPALLQRTTPEPQAGVRYIHAA
jgi:EAL domain-containing protein (putative c-di-GMP-specific phosphodiesterase class I)